MNFFIVLASTFLVCSARPQTLTLQPTVYSSWPFVSAVPSVSQYHAQDALGQYSYGYSGGPSAKSEVKTLDGVTRGSYSYIDANSKLQTVEYVADALGFRVAATNLPTPPIDAYAALAAATSVQAPLPVEDTVEVKQARAEHLAAVAKARSESSEPEVEEVEAPETVEDTEKVKQARVEHLEAVEEAKSRSLAAIVEAQPQLIQVPAAIHLAHAPLTILRSSAPTTSFAYSVLAPGYSHVITA